MKKPEGTPPPSMEVRDRPFVDVRVSTGYDPAQNKVVLDFSAEGEQTFKFRLFYTQKETAELAMALVRAAQHCKEPIPEEKDPLPDLLPKIETPQPPKLELPRSMR